MAGVSLVSALTVAALSGAGAATDRQTRTVPLPDGRALSVTLTVGSLRVRGESRADARIEIERTAPSEAALAQWPIGIDEAPSRVHVSLTPPDAATDPAYRTDVTLRVPRGAALGPLRLMEGPVDLHALDGAIDVEVQRGAIEGADLAGRLRLETQIGDIVLSRVAASPEGMIRLRTFNGDVRLGLRQVPADARILALALNGSIDSTIPLRTKDSWGPRWGEATLGRGTPVISIDVVTGRIVIDAGK